MAPQRADNDRDDDEVVILRGSHARRFLGYEDDEEPEDDAPEGHEYDDDGYLRRVAKPAAKAAKKAAPAKKRGFFDPR